jgi:hypothetical protein
MEGWIKLHRKFLDHWLCDEYRPLTKREAWENMLFYANYEDDKTMIKGQLIECKRGQICYSLETYAKKFNWSIGQVRQFFQLLKNDGMIKVEGMKYTTRLTICNYDEYQDKQQTDNKLTTDCEQTDDILPTTSKEGEESKEVKNRRKKKEFIPPTLEEVKKYFNENGYNEYTAEKMYKSYSVADWYDSKNNKISNWKQKAINVWFRDENKINSQKRQVMV